MIPNVSGSLHSINRFVAEDSHHTTSHIDPIYHLVTGGGSLNPSGLSFPGAYKVAITLIVLSRDLIHGLLQATDPGILFNPYQGEAANKVCKGELKSMGYFWYLLGIRPSWWIRLRRAELSGAAYDSV